MLIHGNIEADWKSSTWTAADMPDIEAEAKLKSIKPCMPKLTVKEKCNQSPISIENKTSNIPPNSSDSSMNIEHK